MLEDGPTEAKSPLVQLLLLQDKGVHSAPRKARADPAGHTGFSGSDPSIPSGPDLRLGVVADGSEGRGQT